MTRFTRSLTAVSLLSLAVAVSLGSSGGSPGGYSGAPGESNCMSCHSGSPQGAGPLSIVGPAAIAGAATLPIQVTFGTTVAPKLGFELSMRNSAGTKVGSWTITDPANTKSLGGNVTQTNAGNQLKTWNMTWNVPATLPAGPITFYAAGLKGNGGGSGGDLTYLTSLPVYQSGLSSTSPNWPIGTVQSLSLNAPKRAGNDYILAMSSGIGPTPYGGVQVPIDLSSSFVLLSLSNPALFQNFIGTLNGAGQAQANVVLPQYPFIVGLKLHFAYVTFAPGTFNLTDVSNRFTATLTP
jgi:hypothetical protein